MIDMIKFFKPTGYKTFLSIVIFITLFLAINPGCNEDFTCGEGKVYYHPPFSCTAMAGCVQESGTFFHNLFDMGFYLGEIIVSYLAACLIFIKGSLLPKDVTKKRI